MQPSATHQVFQTANRSRWQRFQWGSRLLLFVFALLIVVLVIVIRRENNHPPELPNLHGIARKAVAERKEFLEQQDRFTQLDPGFARFINTKWKKGARCGDVTSADQMHSSIFNDSIGIRSAYYVAWDPQSYFSLKRNISKLNLVLPEWYFLDPAADTVITNIDQRGYDIIKASGVKVIPMLSNNYNEQWRGEVVHRILQDSLKKERLINSLVKLLKKDNFAGINIDFEELTETDNESLTHFEKQLYEKLHAQNLLVTQDVIPFNSDYDYASLSKYNDYLFLMAYDEHSVGSKPGPVASQKWQETAVDQVAKQVAPEKIVLCMPGYGYDWSGNKDPETLTYQEALTIARESEGTVNFNNDTYNLQYNYYDDSDALHHVYFTDAATNFNTIRFATEYGLAGTAMWRLGDEDSRLWNFYNKLMTKTALAKFDFNKFRNVQSNNDVDFIGEGEILDVLSQPVNGVITSQIDTSEMLISEEHYDSLPSMFVVKKYGKPAGKKMVLTFDDGPDPAYTGRILNILSKYHVPASFFLVGMEAESNIPLVKRIYNEGHEIGNHTFSHPNMATVSNERASLEMDVTRLLIECITGHSTIMFRAPFNADSEPEKMEELKPVYISREKNYLTVGENIDPEDWTPAISADSIFNRVVRYQDKGNIILLHDAGGNREATVQALPRIIKYFQKRGYTFTTVANLLGRKKSDVMPPVAKGKGYYLVQFSYLLALIGYYCENILFSLFIVFLVLGVIRVFSMAVLSIRQYRKEKTHVFAVPRGYPLVSIIVPAYNEEVNAVQSLKNLLRCDYPNFNIIFVDDGSKDNTFSNVEEAFAGNGMLKVYTKVNGGKASALNFGINQTEAGYVVCIDADTRLKPNAVSMLMRHFFQPGSDGKRVGAVAGNVKVGNEVNYLTKWQSIEYTTSQNFDRRAFANLNAITVVPGAIGAFDKAVLTEVGGFTVDTLAEDCDLTVRILRGGYVVENENNAVAVTEAPENLGQFLKQRFRWSFGVMQTFWKHRDLLFNPRYGKLGLFAFPNILVFQFIIPVFSPLADLFMFFGLLTGNGEKIFGYYLLFILVDAAISLFAFALEKERPAKLLWLIPQRLVYRWLMYIVLFRSFRKAIKGELQGWGVLKRTGNVSELTVT